jgi:DNA-binding IscR family transcriptional regulator
MKNNKKSNQSEIDCTKTLTYGGWVVTNEVLTRTIGCYPAVVLGKLYSVRNVAFAVLCDKRPDLTLHSTEFFVQQHRIAESLGISDRTVRSIITKLHKLKLISIRRKGCPAKNYYRINDTRVMRLCEAIVSKEINSDLNRQEIPHSAEINSDLHRQEIPHSAEINSDLNRQEIPNIIRKNINKNETNKKNFKKNDPEGPPYPPQAGGCVSAGLEVFSGLGMDITYSQDEQDQFSAAPTDTIDIVRDHNAHNNLTVQPKVVPIRGVARSKTKAILSQFQKDNVECNCSLNNMDDQNAQTKASQNTAQSHQIDSTAEPSQKTNPKLPRRHGLNGGQLALLEKVMHEVCYVRGTNEYDIDVEDLSDTGVWKSAVALADYLLRGIRCCDVKAETHRQRIDVIREWAILIHPYLLSKSKQGRSFEDIRCMIDFVFDENNYDPFAEFNWRLIIVSMKKFTQHISILAGQCCNQLDRIQAEKESRREHRKEIRKCKKQELKQTEQSIQELLEKREIRERERPKELEQLNLLRRSKGSRPLAKRECWAVEDAEWEQAMLQLQTRRTELQKRYSL